MRTKVSRRNRRKYHVWCNVKHAIHQMFYTQRNTSRLFISAFPIARNIPSTTPLFSFQPPLSPSCQHFVFSFFLFLFLVLYFRFSWNRKEHTTFFLNHQNGLYIYMLFSHNLPYTYIKQLKPYCFLFTLPIAFVIVYVLHYTYRKNVLVYGCK